ncbi:hypothetical protein AB0I46_43875, partial [Streptomyces spectabilis]|uniref:hypothetical protein n=1 Tax=Streptomyces spectabilis TaxID=68270 RepID=UPI0033F8D8E1
PISSVLSGLSAFRRFRLYQIFSASRSVPIFIGAFQVSAFAFPFPADPTLSEILGRSDRLRIPIHRVRLLG